MEEALKRILTPKRSTDILREAQAARDRGRPYTVVFVGVNGVGKSTNLAKVAYWLQQHEMKARTQPTEGLEERFNWSCMTSLGRTDIGKHGRGRRSRIPARGSYCDASDWTFPLLSVSL